MVLRVCSFLAHAGTGAAAGWGYLIANERFKLEAGAAALSTDVVKSLSSLNQSFAFFQGIMATYYWCVSAHATARFGRCRRWSNRGRSRRARAPVRHTR